MVSRITGMLRDMVMAYAFGASAQLAAFLLAYRFVYLIRRLFGESLLHQGFIPRFEAIRSRDSLKAARFFRDLMASLSIVLLLLIVAGEGVLSLIGGEVSTLMSWMLPGTFFLCLFGLTSGLLNTEKSFFIPAVSPAVFNIVWILGVLAVAKQPIEGAVFRLALIVTVALVFQFGMTLPKVASFLRSQLRGKDLWKCRPFSKDLAGLSTPLLLGVVGVAAVQVNSAVDGVFARFAALEGPAYLWYAIRMQQLPLALFGLALSSALLPSLSRSFERGDQEGFRALIRTSLLKIHYLLIPCTIGIFVLGASSVNLLFGRGDFDALATTQTTLCLWGYGLGLVPMAVTQILASSYYARKDYRTPALGFLYSAILNIAVNALLVFGLNLGPASIALATSGAALFNVLYLKKGEGIRVAPPFVFTSVVVVCGLMTVSIGNVMGDATLRLFSVSPEYARQTLTQLVQFGIQASFFFGSLALILKIIFRKQWRSLVRVLLAK